MKEFFKDLIDKLPVLTGIDMLSWIPVDQIDLHLNELIATGEQAPYHLITNQVKQRLIMENIYTDESFARPPYGCKPGLNRRVLTKWYRHHWEHHGNVIQRTKEETDTRYKEYVAWAEENSLPVLPEGQYPTDERVQEYIHQIAKHLTIQSV